ncbi:GntR family transcriptional regulator [Kribbella sp. NPDC059898]|uniref:GntR family transcriptional regulator n=1 Tax=Kribbella sp. NPDC059898 TaxID=3346995 RepID=UPI003658D0DF
MRRSSDFTSRLARTTAAAGEMPPVESDLRHAILTGDQPPGTSVPIDEVAAFFGVSAIPVREALKTLFGEGLVEHRPHIGYRVAKLTFLEFRELYDVRQALEAAALRAAAVNATAADHDRIRGTHDSLAAASAAGDRQYAAATRRFHFALIEPSGMHRLIRMYETAWNITEPARPMSRVPAHERAEFRTDHERLISAYVARDLETLIAESERHYTHLKSAIAEFADDPECFADPV